MQKKLQELRRSDSTKVERQEHDRQQEEENASHRHVLLQQPETMLVRSGDPNRDSFDIVGFVRAACQVVASHTVRKLK